MLIDARQNECNLMTAVLMHFNKKMEGSKTLEFLVNVEVQHDVVYAKVI